MVKTIERHDFLDDGAISPQVLCLISSTTVLNFESTAYEVIDRLLEPGLLGRLELQECLG